MDYHEDGTPNIGRLAELRRSDRLRRARLLSPTLCAIALGEAMPWLDGTDRERAGAWLIDRAARGERATAGLSAVAGVVGRLVFGGREGSAPDEAVYQLARTWPFVPEQLRLIALGVGSASRWSRAIERAVASEDPNARAAAAEIAGSVGSTAALRQVLGLLGDPHRGVQVAAERALVRATGRAALLASVDGREAADGHDRDSTDTGHSGDDQDQPAAVAGVEDLIAEAVLAFEHHRRFGVMLAAMTLLSDAAVSAARRGGGTSLARWFAGSPTGGHGALRMVLRKADLAVARERALSWVILDGMSNAAGDRLGRASTPGEHEAVLCRTHLTRRLLRRSRLASLKNKPRFVRGVGKGVEDADGGASDETEGQGVGRPSWPEACAVPDETTLAGLSERARAGVGEWMAAAGVDRPTRAHLLCGLLGDDSPRVRASLVRWGPTTLLEDLAYDVDGSVARSAVLRLSRAGEPLEAPPAAGQPLASWAVSLGRHPEASVRALGAQEAARARGAGDDARAASAQRAALDLDRAGASAALAARVASGPTGDRLAALRLARRVGLIEASSAAGRAVLEATLEAVRAGGPGRASAGEDALRVAATAVRALALVPGEEAEAALRGALEWPDRRICANALEALAARHRRGLRASPAPADGLLDESHPRVRANAVRAALFGRAGGGAAGSEAAEAEGAVEAKDGSAATDRAMEALRSMLGDDRAGHRVSGLWVAGRALRRGPELALGPRWTDLAAVIADMARHDADSGARARAAACMGTLEAEARERWQRPGPQQDEGGDQRRAGKGRQRGRVA